MGENTYYLLLPFLSPEKGVPAQLFTKVYYSMEAVQVWSREEAEEGRAAGGQEPGSPTACPP